MMFCNLDKTFQREGLYHTDMRGRSEGPKRGERLLQEHDESRSKQHLDDDDNNEDTDDHDDAHLEFCNCYYYYSAGT